METKCVIIVCSIDPCKPRKANYSIIYAQMTMENE